HLQFPDTSYPETYSSRIPFYSSPVIVTGQHTVASSIRGHFAAHMNHSLLRTVDVFGMPPYIYLFSKHLHFHCTPIDIDTNELMCGWTVAHFFPITSKKPAERFLQPYLNRLVF